MITLPIQIIAIDNFLLEVALATVNVLNLDGDVPVDVNKSYRDLGAESSDMLLVLKGLGENPGDFVQGERLTQYAKNLVREVALRYAVATPEREHLVNIEGARGRELLEIITPKDIAEIMRYEEMHR